MKLQARISRLSPALAEELKAEKIPAALKYALNKLDICSDRIAKPKNVLTDKEKRILKVALKRELKQKNSLPQTIKEKVSPELIELDDKFIKKILKRKVTQAQKNVIRKIIEYFWQNEGWASFSDLVNHLGYHRATFWRQGYIDAIDFKKLKKESKAIKMPVPIYLKEPYQKERLLRIIRIIKGLGSRASIYELAKVIGLKSPENAQFLDIFTNCKNAQEFKGFIKDVNYNRKLSKKIPIKIVRKEKKETHDKFICALEAFDGKATPYELGKVLNLSPSWVGKISREIDFVDLNKRRRAVDLMPLIGVINGRSRTIQDEIIYSLESLGGVASIQQINNYSGQNKTTTRNAIKKIDFNILNEIRQKEGVAPLFVVGEKDQRNLRDTLRREVKLGKIGDVPDLIRDTLELYSEYFGEEGKEAFIDYTIPFACSVIYNNGKIGLARVKSGLSYERLHNILQRVLVFSIRYAYNKNLHKQGMIKKGKNILEYKTLNNYFKFAVPRALNVSRYILASNKGISKYSSETPQS
ncbi:hypothetical protein ES705_35640 [subsurface metagenome]